MPTKLNKAGKQQEYIPAGNGDPSGEYGENSGKGNKNIKLGGGHATPNVIDDNNQNLTGKNTPKENPKGKEQEDKPKPNIIDNDNTANGVKKGKKKIKAEGKTKKEQTNSVNEQTKKYITPPFEGKLGYDGMDIDQAEQSGQAVVDVFDDFPNCFKYIKKCGTTAGVRKDGEKKLTQEEIDKIKEDVRRLATRFKMDEAEIQEQIDYVIKNREKSLNQANWRIPSDARGACAHAMGDKNSDILIKQNNTYDPNKRFTYGERDNEICFTCDTSAYGTQTHELGHAIDNVIGRIDSEEVHKAYVEIGTLFYSTDPKKLPSRYARYNKSEFIAECFASHYSGNTNETAEKVFNIIKGLYDKWSDRI